MSRNGFLDMDDEFKSEESMLIEQADLDMAEPNLVDFIAGDTGGKYGCALTLRVWLVGLTLSVVMGAFSQLMMMRTVPIMISPLIQVILAFPLGNFYAFILPKTTIKLFRFSFSLNPGPFSLREHALAVLLASGGNAPSVGLITEVVRASLFKQKQSAIAGFLSGLASILVGIAFGGLISNMVVWPKEMTWPIALMNVSLTKALHERRYFPSASRIKFFWIIAGGAFAYHFLPGYLFTSLTSLSFLCWMKPSSPIMSQLGSGMRGLGIGAISLDWSLIVAYFSSPLVYPFYAAANLFAGFVLFMWVMIPSGYYGNIWNTQRYPIQSFSLYDTAGLPYKTEAVLKNGVLDDGAYYEAGPVRMTWMFFSTYFVSLAAVSAAVTHVALYHGLDIADLIISWYRYLRGELITTKFGGRKVPIMGQSQVPLFWYGIILAVGIALGITSIQITPARETVYWYTIIVAALIAGLFVIPVAWIAGMTSYAVNIHILAELIAGVLWPGNGSANLYFRSYSYFAVYAAINFCVDLKFGQYMKLPPRHVLLVRLVGIIVTSVVHTVITYSMLDNVPGMCESTSLNWACTSFQTLKPSTFIWGTIGPIRLFATSSIYHPMVYALLFGFLLPVPFYLLHLQFPDSWVSYINIPILLSGAAFAPAAPTAQFLTWFMVAFIFNYVLFQFRQSWWLRKNLLLSAGLDFGTAVAGLLIGLSLMGYDFRPQWWGNDPDGGCPLAKFPLDPSPALKAFLSSQPQ